MAGKGCGCKTPGLQRINEEGFIEQSFDGGLTWFRFPDDERFNAPTFPPLVGIPLGDLPCAMAASAKEAARIEIELFKTNADVWDTVLTVAGVLIEFLSLLLGPVGRGVALLVTTLAYLLWNFTKTAFLAYDWDAALEQFFCIYFCNIEEDGTWTEQGWQQAKQDIVDQMDGFGEVWFWNHVEFMGPVGLQNAGSIFPGLLADCSSCACGACLEPTTDSPQGGQNLIPRPDLGAGFWQVTTKEYLGGGGDNFYAQIDLGCCLLQSYEVQAPGVNAAPGNRVAIGCAGAPTHTGNYGVGSCLELILFRSFGEATFIFQILDCP